MALTPKEATFIYECLVRTGFAEPGKEHLDEFVAKQTSGIVIVCVIPSPFYPAQFFSSERDGGRWQVELINATPEQRELVKTSNQELFKLWKSFQ